MRAKSSGLKARGMTPYFVSRSRVRAPRHDILVYRRGFVGTF